MAKSWLEKYHNGKPPQVKKLNYTYGGMKPGDNMLISSPEEIDAYIRAIPFGETRSVDAMRKDLAKKHGADGTCPLTTGIFTRIVAEVAIEDMVKGKSAKEVTPFWRVVVPGSPLAKKLTCGESMVVELRAQEGIR
jgi:hypothetical protein